MLTMLHQFNIMKYRRATAAAALSIVVIVQLLAKPSLYG